MWRCLLGVFALTLCHAPPFASARPGGPPRYRVRCDPEAVCPAPVPPPSLDALPAWRRIRRLLAGPPSEVDLAELNLLVSQARDPSVNVRSQLTLLDLMAREVRSRFPARCNDRCKLRALNRYLFRDWALVPEFDPSGLYRDVERDLLDRILQTHRGYCEGLSYLYLALGRRLGLRLVGVDARQHMYVRYVGGDGPPFDLDPTRQGGPPLPDPQSCRAAPGVYGVPLSDEALLGQMLGVLAIGGGYVTLPWLDEAIRHAPRAPALRNNRANERARFFDARGALEDYHEARTLDPCSPLYAMNEARLLWALGRREEARALVTGYESRFERGELTEGRAFVSLVRASFAFEERRDADADAHLRAALEQSDGAPMVLEVVGSIRLAQGRTREAISALRGARLLDPTARTRLGLIHALLAADRVAEAAAQLDRAVREAGSAGALDLYVAQVAARQGRYDDARALARRCLSHAGLRCSRALVVLGDVARARHDLACAGRYYEAWLSCPHRLPSRANALTEAEVRALAARSLAGR